jgi:hypothetical protein
MRRYPSGEVLRGIVVGLIAVAAAAACGSQSSSGTGGSGVFGTVQISPASPVCRTGTSCSRAAKRFRLVFSRNGRSVTVTTDAHGRYRVTLERGRYSVRPAVRPTNPKQGLQPAAVTVPRGRFVKRDLTYDSGIR